MDKKGRRKNIRIVLAVLAIFPIVLLVYNLIFLRTDYGEDSIQELAFLWFGIPILVLDFWAWAHPEIIEFLLWGDKKDKNN